MADSVEIQAHAFLENLCDTKRSTEDLLRALRALGPSERPGILERVRAGLGGLGDAERAIADTNMELLQKKIDQSRESAKEQTGQREFESLRAELDTLRQEVARPEGTASPEAKMPTVPPAEKKPEGFWNSVEKQLDVTQWSDGKKATAATLTFGAAAILGFLAWRRSRKLAQKTEGTANAQANAVPPPSSSKLGMALRMLLWVPVIGLAGYGVYRGAKWFDAKTSNLDYFKKQADAWFKHSEEVIKEARAMKEEGETLLHRRQSGLHEKYGIPTADVEKAEQIYLSRPPELAAQEIGQLFGALREQHPGYKVLMADLGKFDKKEEINGVRYVSAEWAMRNYELGVEQVVLEIGSWARTHSAEVTLAAAIAARMGVLHAIVSGGKTSLEKAIEIGRKLTEWGIKHPFASLAILGGSFLGLRQLKKSITLPVNLHQLSKAALSEGMPIARGAIDAGSSAVLEGLRQAMRAIGPITENVAAWAATEGEKLFDLVRENIPEGATLDESEIIERNAVSAFGVLQNTLDQKRLTALQNDDRESVRGLEFAQTALVNLETEYLRFRASDTGLPDGTADALATLSTALGAVDITIETNDNIVQWRSKGMPAAIDLCVSPNVTDKLEMKRLSQKLRAEESFSSFVLWNAVEQFREREGNIMEKGGGGYTGVLVGHLCHIFSPTEIGRYWIVPVDLLGDTLGFGPVLPDTLDRGDMTKSQDWAEHAQNWTAAGITCTLFSIPAFAALKAVRFAIGGGPWLRSRVTRVAGTVIPGMSQINLFNNLRRVRDDARMVRRFGWFHGRSLNNVFYTLRLRPEYVAEVMTTQDVVKLRQIASELNLKISGDLEVMRTQLKEGILRKIWAVKEANLTDIPDQVRALWSNPFEWNHIANPKELANGPKLFDMMAAGWGDARGLLNAGYTVRQLLDAQMDAQKLLQAGVAAEELLDAGVNVRTMVKAGAKIEDLFSAGVSSNDLLKCGVTQSAIDDAKNILRSRIPDTTPSASSASVPDTPSPKSSDAPSGPPKTDTPDGSGMRKAVGDGVENPVPKVARQTEAVTEQAEGLKVVRRDGSIVDAATGKTLSEAENMSAVTEGAKGTVAVGAAVEATGESAEAVKAEAAAEALSKSDEAKLKSLLTKFGNAEDAKNVRAFLEAAADQKLLKIDTEVLALIDQSPDAQKIIAGAVKSGEITEVSRAMQAAARARNFRVGLNAVGAAGDLFGAYMAYHDYMANGGRIESARNTQNAALAEMYRNANYVYATEGAQSAAGLTIGGVAIVKAAVGGESLLTALGASGGVIMLPVAAAAVSGGYVYRKAEMVSETWMRNAKDWERALSPGEILEKLKELGPGKRGYWQGWGKGTVAEQIARLQTAGETGDGTAYSEWEEEGERNIEKANESTRLELTKAYVVRTSLLAKKENESDAKYQARFDRYVMDQMEYIGRVTDGSFSYMLGETYANARRYAEMLADMRAAGKNADALSWKNDSDPTDKQREISVHLTRERELKILQFNLMQRLPQQLSPEQKHTAAEQDLILACQDDLLKLDGRISATDFTGVMQSEAVGEAVARFTASELFRERVSQQADRLLTQAAKPEGLTLTTYADILNRTASVLATDPLELQRMGVNKRYVVQGLVPDLAATKNMLTVQHQLQAGVKKRKAAQAMAKEKDAAPEDLQQLCFEKGKLLLLERGATQKEGQFEFQKGWIFNKYLYARFVNGQWQIGHMHGYLHWADPETFAFQGMLNSLSGVDPETTGQYNEVIRNLADLNKRYGRGKQEKKAA